MTLVLSPKKLGLALTAVVLCLILAHVASQAIYLMGHDVQLGFYKQFHLDMENNIPTWYTSSALLLCAGFLAGIGLYKKQVGDRYAGYWLGLAIIFLYLSVDEAASLHEMTVRPLQAALHPDGYLSWPWVIPFGTFAIIIGLVYLRFLASLPRWTRYQFIIAGTLYVGGALGLEMMAANYVSLYGGNTTTYRILYTCEESFEMLGIVVFIYSLASYMSQHVKKVTVQIAEGLPIGHIASVRRRENRRFDERAAA